MIDALENMRVELQEAAEKDLDDARSSFQQKIDDMTREHENNLREQRNAINAG